MIRKTCIGIIYFLLFSTLCLAAPSITSPTPGGALPYPNTGTVTFTFDDVALMTVTEYKLFIGTCSAGACSSNIYNSTVSFGPIVADVSGTTMHTVTVVPTDGSHIFVSLWYKEVGGSFTKIVYEYEATGDPSINAPTSGSTFSYNRATFVWDSNFAPVAEYNLIVGTTSGGSDIADSGTLTSATESLLVNKDNTTPPFVGLPTDGSTIFVNLGFNTSIGAPFTYVEYTYTAAGGSIVPPTISSPSPGSTLSGTSTTFTIDPGFDPSITALKVLVGTRAGGALSKDILAPLDISIAGPTYTFTVDSTSTKFPYVGLPNDGGEIFVTINYKVGGVFFAELFTFIADTDVSLPMGRTFKVINGAINDFTVTNETPSMTPWPDTELGGGIISTSTTAPVGDYAVDTITALNSPLISVSEVTDSFVSVGLVHEYALADAGDFMKLSYSVDGGPRKRFASFTGTSTSVKEAFTFPSLALTGGTSFQIHLELISNGAGVAGGWSIDSLIISNSSTGSGLFTVTSSADSGPGSLRDTLASTSVSGGVIVFDPSVTLITLSTGLLNLEDGVNIIGPGAALLTIDAASTSGVFGLDPNFSACISGLTVTGGLRAEGGGIQNNGGILEVSDSVFIANTASVKGAGIWSNSVLIVNRCLFDGNSATNEGGGIFNKGTGSLSVTNSTFEGNSASSGGGIGIANSSTSTNAFTNSTFSGNMTSGNGGGLYSNGMTTITNCTIFENSALRGGGIFARTGSTATISNTIVALNTASLANPDVHGTVYISTGSNFVGIIGAAVGFGAAGDMIGTAGSPLDPLLGALAANGGPTPTHLPLPGSPVIDTSLGTSLTLDQRGLPRPVGAPDIGSVEVQP